MPRTALLAAALAGLLATPALADPLTVSSHLLVEKRVPQRDGSVRITAVPAARATPGDRVTVTLGYRNTGPASLSDLVLANPVPRGLAFRSADASPIAPELSVDGRRFGPLATLRVALPGGGTRPAVADDVAAVRWRLPGTVAPGAAGQLSFHAVLR